MLQSRALWQTRQPEFNARRRVAQLHSPKILQTLLNKQPTNRLL